VTESVELLVRLIQDGCVNDGTPDSGGEHRAVGTLLDYFGVAGRVFEPHPGRRSLLYRVPGRVPGAPSLMLMGHTDVVPASRHGWVHDPFEGVIADGFVWGRGAVDMLNLTAAMAVVFKPYVTGEREPLPGDLLYLAVADEEAGGRLGAKWLVDNHWDEVGCDYQLTEIAYPPVVTPDGPAYPVAVAEKGAYWRVVTAQGVPGHGSQPYGRDNAVVDLGKTIARLAEAPTPVEITNEWRAIVEVLGFLGPAVTEALLDPDAVDGAIEAIAAADPALARIVHALTHMTVSPNVVRGGVKSNVIAEAGIAEIDIRTLPGQDETTVDEHFRKVLGSELYDRLQMEPVMDHPSTRSEAEGPLWEALGDGYEAVAGTRRRFPSIITGGTDARFFRPKGTVAYGAGLFDDRFDTGQFATMFHGHNERVSVASMALTTEFLAVAVERFGVRSVAG
jgi:acetylornithine deacetylase/succinyl-diaminopimelate desuccinylase-like protein